MLWSCMYRAHLPPPKSNVKQDAYAPLRASANLSYAYRALASGYILPSYRPPVPAQFLFEYDVSPYVSGGVFLRNLQPEDFGIQPPDYRIYFLKPIALYGSGWFLKGVHKLPGFKGMDAFFSTVPPESEGKPWWGEYYDPNLRELYNPPPEHAFAEDYRSYIYLGDPREPRVCCPALIPTHVWERLRFFIRFFDTVYILKPTEYARRRYYRFVEEELPAIMRTLQGLSWLSPVDAPPDAIGVPTTDTSVFLSITLGEAYYSASRLLGGEYASNPGDEIIAPPSYLPTPLSEGAQIAHLNSGRWKWSPNSGYWPPPTNPTWWDIGGFTVHKAGVSLLHLLAYYNYGWEEEGAWAENIRAHGAADKVFASYTTGYYDQQGNWIMPPFTTAVPPLLIVNSTSGDFLVLELDEEDIAGETVEKVFVRGDDRRRGRMGSIEYKVRFILTTTVRITYTPAKRLREGAKFYAPPSPDYIRRTFSPYFELEGYFSYPIGRFLEKERRKLQYAPRDVNRFDRLRPPSNLAPAEGVEKLWGISFHVAILPTGEHSNVTTIVDPNSGFSVNGFVDNIAVELGETPHDAECRSWLEGHLQPAFAFAIPAIRKELLQRRYIHPRMPKKDISVWQIKMQERSPDGGFPVTLTTEKEVVSLSEYMSSVGVDITDASDEVRGIFTRHARRLLAYTWNGQFAAYPEKVTSFAALFKSLSQSNKFIADFPYEDSPQVVVFRSPAVSPPELQWVGRYMVAVPPATALLWEWVYKDNEEILRRHIRIYGFAASAPNDKDLCAEVLRRITLRPLVQCDFAFLRYDPIDDSFYIIAYNQPIVAAAWAGGKETRTQAEYYHSPVRNLVYNPTTSPFGSTDVVFGSQVASGGGLGAGAHLWERFLSVVQSLNLRDNPSMDIVQQLRNAVETNVFPAVRAEYRNVDMFLRRIFSDTFQVSDAFSENIYEKMWLSQIGIRGLLLERKEEEKPTKWTLGEDMQPRNNFPFLLWSTREGGAIVATNGGVKTATIENKGPRAYWVLLDGVAKSEILLLPMGESTAWQDKNYLNLTSLVYHSLLTPSRLRAALYTVWDARNFGARSIVLVRDSRRYAYLLSSLCSYAPMVFSDIPEGGELRLFYPVDVKDVLAKAPHQTAPQGRQYQQANLPQGKERMQWHDLVSERWVVDAFAGDGRFLIAYPIPPHQRNSPDGKGIPLPANEFILQVLPLWLLNCYETPVDGALRSAAFTWSGGRSRSVMPLLRVAPKLTYTFTPKMVAPEDAPFTHDLLIVPDRIIVPKLEKPFPPAKLLLPDNTEVWLYRPYEGAEAFWDEVVCGGQGYCIPIFPYDRKKNRYELPPRLENGFLYPESKTLHVNFSAWEEIWFNGAVGMDGDIGASLRLDPRHPYHWRIYLNIFLPHPILPKVYAKSDGKKINFMHMEEEPLYMVGLVRWNTPPSPEYFAGLHYETEAGRAANLIRNWDATLQNLGGLPTLKALRERIRTLSDFLNGLYGMLTYGARGDDFANDAEYSIFQRLVRYYTKDVQRLDYAPCAAYYAPIHLNETAIEKFYINKETLGWDERVPACLLVLPYPRKVAEEANVFTFEGDVSLYNTAGIALVAPSPTTAPASLGAMDFATAYFFLQEHLRFANNHDNNFLVNFYTFVPSDEQLQFLAQRDNDAYKRNIPKVRAGLQLMRWTALFSSVFVFPFYPSIWELHQSVRDALALGMWRLSEFLLLGNPTYTNANLFSPLAHQPYPNIVAVYLAVHQAWAWGGANARWRALLLNLPPKSLQLSLLYPNPLLPTILLQTTDLQDGAGRYFTVLDLYLTGEHNNSLAGMVNALVGNRLEVLFPLCTPLGGYLSQLTVPAPPHPTAPFTSLFFLKPDFLKLLFTKEKNPSVVKMPMWGMEINARVTFGDAILKDIFTTATYADCDFISVPFAGGVLALPYIALLAVLRQSQSYPTLMQRLTCATYYLIPYDGGLLFKSTKKLTFKHKHHAFFSLDRYLFLPAFPYFVRGGGGKGGGGRRSWIWDDYISGLQRKWVFYEIPPYTLASENYPLSPFLVQLAANAPLPHLPNMLERVLRVCPQRETKFLVYDDAFRAVWLSVNKMLHLHAPFTGWLPDIRILVALLENQLPTQGLFRLSTAYTENYDLRLIDLWLSQQGAFWLFVLNRAVNLALTEDAAQDELRQEP